MDFDSSTPFARHFRDSNFDLRSGGERTEDATLWMSFTPEQGSMSMSVYDGAARARSHELTSTDPAAVAGFIRSVEASYGKRVPQHFGQLAEEYLRALDDSFGLTVELRKPTDCEYCGVNSDELEAFYFPAVEPSGLESLAIYNRFGCYSSIEVFGDPRDPEIAAEAFRILRLALSSATKKRAKRELTGFIAALSEILGEGR